MAKDKCTLWLFRLAWPKATTPNANGLTNCQSLSRRCAQLFIHGISHLAVRSVRKYGKYAHRENGCNGKYAIIQVVDIFHCGVAFKERKTYYKTQTTKNKWKWVEKKKNGVRTITAFGEWYEKCGAHTAAHTVPTSDSLEFAEEQSLSFRLEIMSFGADTANSAMYFKNSLFGGVASAHSKIVVLLHSIQFDLHFCG